MPQGWSIIDKGRSSKAPQGPPAQGRSKLPFITYNSKHLELRLWRKQLFRSQNTYY